MLSFHAHASAIRLFVSKDDDILGLTRRTRGQNVIMELSSKIMFALISDMMFALISDTNPSEDEIQKKTKFPIL